VPPRRGRPLEAVPRLSLNGRAPKPAAQPAARGKADSRRHQIARLLADGPKQLAAIAEALAFPHGSMSDLMKHPWFEKGPGRMDPYRLTDLGRGQALAGSPATTAGRPG
jgi:hypothetical protein